MFYFLNFLPAATDFNFSFYWLLFDDKHIIISILFLDYFYSPILPHNLNNIHNTII